MSERHVLVYHLSEQEVAFLCLCIVFLPAIVDRVVPPVTVRSIEDARAASNGYVAIVKALGAEWPIAVYLKLVRGIGAPEEMLIGTLLEIVGVEVSDDAH